MKTLAQISVVIVINIIVNILCGLWGFERTVMFGLAAILSIKLLNAIWN